MRKRIKRDVVVVEYHLESDGTWSESERWPTVGAASSATGARAAARAAGYRCIVKGGTCAVSPDGDAWLVSVYG